MVRRLAAVTLLLSGLVWPAGAQAPASGDPGSRPGCQDSVGLNAPDTAQVYVVATIRTFDPAQQVPSVLLDLALHEIASRFRAPTPLALRAYGGAEDAWYRPISEVTGHLVVNAMYSLQLRRDGRGTDPKVMATSLNPLLDQRVLEAIRAADSAGVMPLLPEEVGGTSAELRLVLSTRPAPPTGGGVVLFRLRTPRVQFSALVKALPKGKSPRYPAEMRSRGEEGEVLAQFVVDRDGNVDLRTLSILRASHIQFAQAALDFLRGLQFAPAHVGGCPVALLVQMPFSFTITR